MSLKSPEGQTSASRPQELRIAVAGAGAMALQHLRAMRSLKPAVRVVGVADPSEGARARALELEPEAEGSPDLGTLLARVDADVVHVCTPMGTHADVAREALAGGCHVYVEKPVTPRLDELDPLLNDADARGLKLCAGHQVLYERPYRRLAELLPALGKIVHAESYFSFRPVRTRSSRGRPLTQGEQLIDVLPHPTYLLLDLLERAAPEGAFEPGSLEVTPHGTVHGSVRKGTLTGTLVVSLEARPVEHWLRAVGTNGWVQADFVRGSVQELLGPGASGIDKALNPFRLSTQLATRSTAALGRKVLGRGSGYPGLEEIFAAFYESIRSNGPSPTSTDQIRGTVRVCHEVSALLEKSEATGRPEGPRDPGTFSEPRVVVTGGTGLLGGEVVKVLSHAGVTVRSVTRRLPPMHERLSGVEYVAADLAGELPAGLLAGARTVIHCAAETSGGWEAHQRNSIDATERLLRAAAGTGVETFVHVSSVAVLDASGRGPVTDDAPLHPDPRKLGPYGWGKLESERLARRLAPELGIELKVLRPVPLVDPDAYAPPGRLGRRLGNLYVAVGPAPGRLVVAQADATARAVATAGLRPNEVPDTMNLVPGEPPTRRAFVEKLRKRSPEVRVVWLPRLVLYPLSWGATLLQKILRPRRAALRLSEAFATIEYSSGPAERLMSETAFPLQLEAEVVRAS